jgi:predicted branched-subunit amino acid permease
LGAASGLLLGVRNALYGLRLGPLLGWTGARRAAAAHLVIDESTAMSVTRSSPQAARVGFLTTGVGVFVLWNLATLVGALAGDALGDPRAYGLDAAVGGAFLALLWPRLDSHRTRVVATLAALLAVALVPVTPAGVPVLAAGVVALGTGLRRSGAP